VLPGRASIDGAALTYLGSKVRTLFKSETAHRSINKFDLTVVERLIVRDKNRLFEKFRYCGLFVSNISKVARLNRPLASTSAGGSAVSYDFKTNFSLFSPNGEISKLFALIVAFKFVIPVMEGFIDRIHCV